MTKKKRERWGTEIGEVWVLRIGGFLDKSLVCKNSEISRD